MFGTELYDITKLKNIKSRAITAENFKGEKGKGGMATEGRGAEMARELGRGFKVSPAIDLEAGKTFELAEIDGPGIIKHIWIADSSTVSRALILRIYWEGSPYPSVEVPLGDFFASADYEAGYAQLTSATVCCNPRRGLNCFWEMPFRKKCRITIENLSAQTVAVFYQIDYHLTEVDDDSAYFHAQFRRSNPLPYKTDHVILDGVSGKGHYVGTYLFWGVNNSGWWGEGELKVFLDGDDAYPTICGTGTEDYFGGAYDFEVSGEYVEYCTPYMGLSKVIRPDGCYRSQQRFSMYRWHLGDAIYFDEDIKVTIQALGWRSEGRYLPLQDDIASVAFWYQDKPCGENFPKLPTHEFLEII